MSTTTVTSSLTVSELPALATPFPGYSLVEALSDAGVHMPQDHEPHASWRPSSQANTVYLWENGCQLDGGDWNCTMACAGPVNGPKLVWNTTNGAAFTYQNCLVYPIIATSAANDWLVESPAGLLEKHRIVPNGTLPLEDSNATTEVEYRQAWPVINHCRQEFCRAVFPWLPTCPFEATPSSTELSLGPSNKLWSPWLVGWSRPFHIGSRKLIPHVARRHAILYSWV